MKCCTQAKLALPLGRTPDRPARVVVFAKPVEITEGRRGKKVGIAVEAKGISLLGAEIRLDAAQVEVRESDAAHAALSFEGTKSQEPPGFGRGEAPPGDPFVNGVQIYPEMRRDLVL